MALIRSLFGSKKFLAMLSGVVGLVTLKVFKVVVDPATMAEIVALIASFILAQGAADVNKEAARITAIANIQAEQAATPAEKVDEIKSV